MCISLIVWLMKANMNSYSRGEGGFGALVVVILVIVLGVLAWNNLIVPGWEKHVMKYDKPWWSGNETQQVCDNTSENCYNLVVASNGEDIEAVYFPNGGYVTVYDWECNKAASMYAFDRFCTIWDSEQRTYDIIPI